MRKNIFRNRTSFLKCIWAFFFEIPMMLKTKKNRSEIASSFPAVARLDLSHVSENKGFGNSQTPTFGGRRRRWRRRRKNLLAASSPFPITPRDSISRSGIPLTPIQFNFCFFVSSHVFCIIWEFGGSK